MSRLEQPLDSEHLESSVRELIEQVLDQYAARRVPKEDTLAECLMAFTKDQLLAFSAANYFEAKSSWRKKKLVTSIKEGILNSMEERFLIVGKEKLTLLQQLIEGKLKAENSTFEEAAFYTQVFPEAVRLGLLYPFEQENHILMIMPEEVKRQLAVNLPNFNHLKREYHFRPSQLKPLTEGF